MGLENINDLSNHKVMNNSKIAESVGTLIYT